MIIILILINNLIYESFKNEISPVWLDFIAKKLIHRVRVWLTDKIDRKMTIIKVYQKNVEQLNRYIKDRQIDPNDAESVEKVISQPDLLPIWFLKISTLFKDYNNSIQILIFVLIAIAMRDLYPKLKELKKN